MSSGHFHNRTTMICMEGADRKVHGGAQHAGWRAAAAAAVMAASQYTGTLKYS